MNTPITRQEWEDLAKNPGKKGIQDCHGIVWKVLKYCGSTARPNALRLQRDQEECDAFWHQNQVWSDLEDFGYFIPESDFNHPNAVVVDLP